MSASATPLSTVAPSPAKRPVLDRVLLIVLFVFCAANVVTAPLRWGLALVKLTPLVYLPSLGLLVGIMAVFGKSAIQTGFTRLQVLTILVFVYGAALGLLQMPLKQVAFGAYVLLPFFFGLACAPVFFSDPQRLRQTVFILWLLACMGVLLNLVTVYPWEGFEYEVAGQTIEGSREWQSTGGGKRFAGFSRASFDAAIQIQLLAILSVMLRQGFWRNLFIWLFSGLAIALTTSKGIYNVFLVLTPIVFFKRLIPEFLCRTIPLSFGLIGLLLPLSVWFVNYNFYISDPFWADLTFSFYDRLKRMWPEAWALMANHGNPFLGRGIGGLGTAQTYFETQLFNAGDNLFMYWLVVFGWPALLIFLPLLLATLWVKPWSRSQDRLPYVLIVAMLVYGLTTNVVENAFFAIVCGMCVYYLAVRMTEVLRGA